MDSRTEEDRTRRPATGHQVIVPHHQPIGDAVRHIHDVGREIGRAFESKRDADHGAERWTSGSSAVADPREKRARKRVKELRDLYTHAGIYSVIISFLFILDLITGSGFWFYWPALGWGVGLAIHAVVVLVEEGIFDKSWEERKVRDLLGSEPRAERSTADRASSRPAKGGDMTGLIERGVDEVAGLRRVSLGIGNPAARAQALRICATADNILAALAEEGRETRLAREFLERYLAPARTIVGQYVRLSSRNVASAQPALARVETNDLPLIERRMGDLYERIHRGDVIDLQVASEMLELGLMEGGASASAPRP